MNEPKYMGTLIFDPKTHVYRVDDRIVPHITEVVPSDYSHVPPNILEKARQRGSAVHKATELYDLGTLNWATLQPEVLPYLEAWIAFRSDYECEFDNYDVERRLYHPIHKYAGTGDRPRAWLTPPNQPRRLATIEIKSIAKMDENVGLQTAAQQEAENYRCRELGIEPTTDRWGIQLRSNGQYRAVQYTDKRHARVFLSYLTCLLWEVVHKKREFAIQGKATGRR